MPSERLKTVLGAPPQIIGWGRDIETDQPYVRWRERDATGQEQLRWVPMTALTAAGLAPLLGGTAAEPTADETHERQQFHDLDSPLHVLSSRVGWGFKGGALALPGIEGSEAHAHYIGPEPALAVTRAERGVWVNLLRQWADPHQPKVIPLIVLGHSAASLVSGAIGEDANLGSALGLVGEDAEPSGLTQMGLALWGHPSRFQRQVVEDQLKGPVPLSDLPLEIVGLADVWAPSTGAWTLIEQLGQQDEDSAHGRPGSYLYHSRFRLTKPQGEVNVVELCLDELWQAGLGDLREPCEHAGALVSSVLGVYRNIGSREALTGLWTSTWRQVAWELARRQGQEDEDVLPRWLPMYFGLVAMLTRVLLGCQVLSQATGVELPLAAIQDVLLPHAYLSPTPFDYLMWRGVLRALLGGSWSAGCAFTMELQQDGVTIALRTSEQLWINPAAVAQMARLQALGATDLDQDDSPEWWWEAYGWLGTKPFCYQAPQGEKYWLREVTLYGRSVGGWPLWWAPSS